MTEDLVTQDLPTLNLCRIRTRNLNTLHSRVTLMTHHPGTYNIGYIGPYILEARTRMIR